MLDISKYNFLILVKNIKPAFQKLVSRISKELFYLRNKNSISGEIRFRSNSVYYLDKRTCLELIGEIFYDRIYYFYTAKKAPVIIDAGANIGISVLYFKQLYPRARVLVFEPEPETFGILEQNIAVNKLDKISLHQAALADAPGMQILYRDSSNKNFVGMALNHRLEGKGLPTRPIPVPSLKLSDFVHADVDLLKLDVEGSEIQVLKELILSKKIQNIKNVILEFHFDPTNKEVRLGALISMLEDNNYNVGFSKHKGTPFVRAPWSQACIIYATKAN